MQQLGFEMKIFPGMEEEYKKRHNDIWPRLTSLLQQTGISDYTIFLNESTGVLFGVLTISDQNAFDNLPEHPVMKEWWAYMKDIMYSNEDNSPVSIPLKKVFYMP